MTTKHAIGLLMAGACLPLFAQSSVQLYGVIDVAIRHTTNEGPADQPHASNTQMVRGGMTQSRIGLNVAEDLGAGLRALAHFEQRIDSTNGSVIGEGYQQSWVGLHSQRLGRLTLGRQYNALTELFSSTFASYPYSPYMESYKPEVGFAMGSRSNELVKYQGEFGRWRINLEATWRGESTTTVAGMPGTYSTGGQSRGGFVRYAHGGLAVGAGYLQRALGGDGKRLKGFAIGGSYRSGPWYFNTAYAMNRHNLDGQVQCGADIQCRVDYSLLSSVWGNSTNGGFGGQAFTVASKRKMLTAGIGYQVTPQLNWGAHYWQARQSGSAAGAHGRAHFASTVLNYALSRRTNVYASVDHTRVSGEQLSLNTASGASNGSRNRTGVTVGIRHRF